MPRILQNFIDGRFTASDGELVSVYNPATGQELARIPDSPQSEVDQAVYFATKAQKSWARLAPIERAVYLRKISARIRENADAIAKTVVEEQGKPMPLAQGEVAFACEYFDYMAEWARRIEGEIISSDRRGENIFLFRQPIGVVAGILPWNFPFFLIARKIAPALITGNTVVIKPSEETPVNADLFARIVQEAELPSGVFNLVYGKGQGAGAALAGHRDVGLVSFTGSVETGSRIMTLAARNITKVNLELGGKAPAIVMNDANVDLAVNAIKSGRLLNSGQVCNSPERVYVQRKVADEFTAKLAAAMQAASYGDPMGGAPVDMGPLINANHMHKVRTMVERAVADGAQVLAGGSAVEQQGGHYFQPTVLAACRQDMEIMQKEVFGPVLPVNVFDDLDEAIERANDSIYGLTSAIYTSNFSTALKACDEIRFGETYINRENFEALQGFHAGVRQSGIGGADGKHGLYENTVHHIVYMQQ